MSGRREPFRRLLGFVALIRAQTGGAFMTTVAAQAASALSEAAVILLLMPLLSGLAGGGMLAGAWQRLGLPTVLALILLAVSARSLAIVAREKASARVSYGFVSSLIERLFAALAATHWSVISRWRVADMTQLVTANNEKLMRVVSQLLSLVQATSLALAYGAVSLWVSWQLTVLAGVVGALILAIAAPAQRRAGRHGEPQALAYRAQFRIADEFLAGLRTAKAFGLEAQHLAAMRNILGVVREESTRFAMDRARMGGVMQVLVAAALAMFMLVAAYGLHLAMPAILTLLFVFMRLVPRVLQLHSITHDLQESIGGVQAMLDLLALAESHRHESALETKSAWRLAEAIEMRGVSYAYVAGQDVLRDVSLTIPAGQITVIAGPTGSGKSTLVDLLLGLIEPDAGEILIDGRVLRSGAARQWQARVAYVPQETYLYNGTIAANLRAVAPGASDEDLWEVLDLAGAAAFVRALPEGLEHAVGDRGRHLSGGERQRLAIARALLRRPELLLLDEATSALDDAKQAHILEGLSRLRQTMTIVAIAHRAEVIAMADLVIMLGDGQVIRPETMDVA